MSRGYASRYCLGVPAIAMKLKWGNKPAALFIIFWWVFSSLTIVGAVYSVGWLNDSLAQVDGVAAVAGLTRNTTVEFDPLGVPTITAENREDVARALGFVHAQERFFQMDLQRR